MSEGGGCVFISESQTESQKRASGWVTLIKWALHWPTVILKWTSNEICPLDYRDAVSKVDQTESFFCLFVFLSLVPLALCLPSVSVRMFPKTIGMCLSLVLNNGLKMRPTSTSAKSRYSIIIFIKFSSYSENLYCFYTFLYCSIND